MCGAGAGAEIRTETEPRVEEGHDVGLICSYRQESFISISILIKLIKRGGIQ
jgi:hypothetical protein